MATSLNNILVLNGGSSSIKATLFQDLRAIWKSRVDFRHHQGTA